MSYDKQEVDRLFNDTKAKLFFKRGAGFLGPLLCNVDFSWDESIPTACTDGVSVSWNPEFFLSLDEETRITVLAHELWHIAYLHLSRRGDKDPSDYNIAADHVINLMLEEHGYYMGGFPYFRDPMFKGWDTDRVYEYIHEKMSSDEKANLPMGDIIGDPSESQEQNTKKNQEALTKVIQAVTVARMSNNAGDVPGEIQFTIDRFLNPKLPWETILYNFFNELVEPDYSYRRPNRRYDDPIMPGLVGMSGLEHLVYYLDISGSISDHNILRFNSEVKFIKEELNPQKLTLVTFDTQIQDEYVFEQDDPFEKIVVTGRGGTSLHTVYEHAKKQQPTAMVIFTDMYVHIPEDAPNCPLIWVAVNNPKCKVPYGKLIHLNN